MCYLCFILCVEWRLWSCVKVKRKPAVIQKVERKNIKLLDFVKQVIYC